jgi:plastocyanin
MTFAPLLAAASAAVLLSPGAARSATHTVSPWMVPMTAVTIDAEVGDDVVWTSVGPGHTVDHLPGLDGQDLDPVTDASAICASLAGAVRIDAGGTATANLTQAGTFYYVCAAAFPLHCNNGMRVRVNVTDPAVNAAGDVEASPWGRVKATYR